MKTVISIILFLCVLQTVRTSTAYATDTNPNCQNETCQASEENTNKYIEQKNLLVIFKSHDEEVMNNQLSDFTSLTYGTSQFYWKHSKQSLHLNWDHIEITEDVLLWKNGDPTRNIDMQKLRPLLRAQGVEDEEYDVIVGISQGGRTYNSQQYSLSTRFTHIKWADVYIEDYLAMVQQYHGSIYRIMNDIGNDMFPNFSPALARLSYLPSSGPDFDFHAQIMQYQHKETWLLMGNSGKWGQIKSFFDADNDGFADYNPSLPFDESKFGSSTSQKDTDGDYLTDLEEYCAGIFNSTNPNNNDTDGDGIIDGLDRQPLYNFPTTIPFSQTSHGSSDLSSYYYMGTQSEVLIFANYDDHFLHLALDGTSCVNDECDIFLDLRNDGLYHGVDNLQLHFSNGNLQDLLLADTENFPPSEAPDYVEVPISLSAIYTAKNDQGTIFMSIPTSSLYDFNTTSFRTIGLRVENSNPSINVFEYDDYLEFSLGGPGIVVNKPAINSKHIQGEKLLVNWSAEGFTGNIELNLFNDNNDQVWQFTSNSANDNFHEVTIPQSIPSGDHYTVEVKSRDTPSISARSEAFMIGHVSSSISVIEPVLGSQHNQGELLSIRWIAEGFTGNLELNLFDQSGDQIWQFTSNTANDNFHQVTIPQSIPTGLDYTIEVKSKDNPNIKGRSNNFNIGLEHTGITILKPDASTVMQQGQQFTYEWESTGSIGILKIELLQNNSLVHTHTPHTANDGENQFIIPRSLQNGSDYTVRISEKNGTIYDDSELFAIGTSPPDEPYIRFVTPNSSEGLLFSTQGQYLSARWETNINENLILSLYKEGSPTPIATNIQQIPGSPAAIYPLPANLEDGKYKFRLAWNVGGVTQLGENSLYVAVGSVPINISADSNLARQQNPEKYYEIISTPEQGQSILLNGDYSTSEIQLLTSDGTVIYTYNNQPNKILVSIEDLPTGSYFLNIFDKINPDQSLLINLND